jgi:hypothetical protein
VETVIPPRRTEQRVDSPYGAIDRSSHQDPSVARIRAVIYRSSPAKKTIIAFS